MFQIVVHVKCRCSFILPPPCPIFLSSLSPLPLLWEFQKFTLLLTFLYLLFLSLPQETQGKPRSYLKCWKPSFTRSVMLGWRALNFGKFLSESLNKDSINSSPAFFSHSYLSHGTNSVKENFKMHHEDWIRHSRLWESILWSLGAI